MTCEQMRTALLVADIEELQGKGGGEVAAHLSSCATCRADAERILGGTMQLGGAIRSRARRRAAAIIVPAAMAAGIALFVLARPRIGVVTPVATSGSTIPSPTAAPAPATVSVDRTVPSAVPSPRPLPHLEPIHAIPVVAVAYTTSSFAPQALSAARPAEVLPHRVLHPTDPNITVLWFE